MADETRSDDQDREPEGDTHHPEADADDDPEPEEASGTTSAAGGPDGPDRAEGSDLGPDADDDTPAASYPDGNRFVMGTLVLHYPQRDVTVVLDGDSGLRLLTMFWQRTEGGLADQLDPFRSSARDGWFVLDLDDVLAMTWVPGLATRPGRTAVDPATAEAA